MTMTDFDASGGGIWTTEKARRAEAAGLAVASEADPAMGRDAAADSPSEE